MPSKILIIDDDEEICKILTIALRDENYEVRTALDGSTALEIAETWQPEIILLDIIMPEMDGFAVLEEMRRRDPTTRTPILIVTALSQFSQKQIGYTKGADDYIVKPINIADLKLRIAAMIRRHQLSAERENILVDARVDLPIVLRRQTSGVFELGYQWSKRVFDVVLSFVALLASLPLLTALGLLIKLDSPGPIIFKHTRVGIDGRAFTMYKLRTMVQDADKLKADTAHLNEMDGPAFKIRNDPRITRLGRFLRRTSLDEIPQFFNVLKGDMSLVGPRPHSWNIDTYKLWQTERLEVRPGITGLWQISGRNEIANYSDWVELDLEYIERQSWRLDILILLQTALVFFNRRGAY